MGEDMLQRLENYFRLSPSPSGLILPPDPHERILTPDQLDYDGAMKRAAVLLPIVKPETGQDSRIMLTLRTRHLRRHAGQVSLPGGSVSPDDDSIVATALREAQEETQLPAHAVSVMGVLPPLLMPSAFHVTPVVGLIDADTPLKPCPNEVEEIFFVPAGVLLNPANYELRSMPFQGRERLYLELNWNGYRIWGATAAILHYLAEQLTGRPATD